MFRSGTNHAFKSSDAQITVGGRIQDKFLWNVKMKNYDIEVNLGFLLLFCFNFCFQKGFYTFCTANKHKKKTFVDHIYPYKNARIKLNFFFKEMNLFDNFK